MFPEPNHQLSGDLGGPSGERSGRGAEWSTEKRPSKETKTRKMTSSLPKETTGLTAFLILLLLKKKKLHMLQFLFGLHVACGLVSNQG